MALNIPPAAIILNALADDVTGLRIRHPAVQNVNPLRGRIVDQVDALLLRVALQPLSAEADLADEQPGFSQSSALHLLSSCEVFLVSMVAYFRAGRKASAVRLLDPGDAGERQRPAELQVQNVLLKRVDQAVYAAPLGRILIVVQKIRILREKINAVYAAARGLVHIRAVTAPLRSVTVTGCGEKPASESIIAGNPQKVSRKATADFLCI